VNLIYGVFHHLSSPAEFLAGLFEDLSLERIELDLVELSGPAFAKWNQHELHASLVADGYAEAIAYQPDGTPAPPTELLYKKALVLAPGLFDNVNQFHSELIQTTLAQLPKEEIEQSKGNLGMFCLSSQMMEGVGAPTPGHLAQRVQDMQKLGFGAMIFRAKELYAMSEFVSRYTKSRVYFAVGLSVMIYALQDRYQHLAGALLEGVARIFSQNVRLSVYPMTEGALKERLAQTNDMKWNYRVTDGMVYVENLAPEGPQGHLFRYLLDSGSIGSARPKA